MRVLHVLAERGWSGGEEQLRFLVEHLCRQGHSNELLLVPGAAFAGLGARLGLRVHTAALRHWWSPRAVLAVRAAVRRAAPDVLHFGCGRSLLFAGLAARGLPVPLRITTRRIDYPIGRAPWRAWRYTRLVDHVVANCAAVRARVLAAGVPPARVTVVHEGIELAPWQGITADRAGARQRLGYPADAEIICCPATLRPRKGQRELVAAFAELAATRPRARLVLAGSGEDLEPLRALARRRGLADRVLVPGPIRPIADLYAASDVFALCSRFEGLANAALEASAAGLPCVVSDAGGLPEIVADGVSGAVVPHGDRAGVVAALRRYLETPELGRAHGRAGAARTAELFPATKMAHKMERLFLDLLHT